MVVFVVAFVVRAWWTLRVQRPVDAVWSDMAGYVLRAEMLLSGTSPAEPRVLALWPWGTHAIVAGELVAFGRDSRIGIGLLHAVVGAVAAPCASSLTARFVPGRAAALLAGLVVAFWHPHVVYGGFFSSELWFTTAALVATVLFVRRVEGKGRRGGAVLAGVCLAIAFVVRPQILLSALLVVAVIILARLAGRRRFVRLPFRARAALVLPLLIAMGASSVRYYRLVGRPGLIAMSDSVMRVFAATDVAKIESSWTAPDGGRWTWWYNPTTKGIASPATTERFEGFIADPDILRRIRHKRLEGVSVGARVRRMVGNVALLAVDNVPWPESEFKTRRRVRLQAGYAKAFYVVFGLAVIGLWRLRRHGAAALAVLAQLATLVFAAAFFFGEARYRVPYDPLLIVVAVVGLSTIGDLVRRAARGA